jgi:hypothetical protein
MRHARSHWPCQASGRCIGGLTVLSAVHAVCDVAVMRAHTPYAFLPQADGAAVVFTFGRAECILPSGSGAPLAEGDMVVVGRDTDAEVRSGLHHVRTLLSGATAAWLDLPLSFAGFAAAPGVRSGLAARHVATGVSSRSHSSTGLTHRSGRSSLCAFATCTRPLFSACWASAWRLSRRATRYSGDALCLYPARASQIPRRVGT